MPATTEIPPSRPTTPHTLTEISLDRWQTLVECHAARSTMHHRAWIELLATHHRLPIRIFGMARGTEIVAAAPFLATPSLTGKWRLSSLPFSDCVPILAVDEQSRRQFVQSLLDDGPFADYSDVTIRDDEPYPSCPSGKVLYRHLVPTDDTPEAIAGNMDRRTRQNIKRAQKHGLRFEETQSSKAIDLFYPLQVATRRKHGVPVQSKVFFQQLHAQIVDAGLANWGLVWFNERVAAAGLLMTYGNNLICKYCASDPALLHLRPNDFFFASSIKAAANGPYNTFDFGTSRACDEGLRRFKRQLGGRETKFQCLRIKGCSDDLGQTASARWAGAIIRRSPQFVTRYLGSLLYRYSQ